MKNKKAILLKNIQMKIHLEKKMNLQKTVIKEVTEKIDIMIQKYLMR